jgi:hypothetical protein
MSFDEYHNYCKNNKIDITKWHPESLHDKIRSGESLTEAETCAKLFLEVVGYVTWTWNSKKP